jgi:hypothetical protein
MFQRPDDVWQERPDDWSQLTPQQKREERFERWLNPIDIKFVSKEAEELYKQRVTRLTKAIKIEEPDRVPVWLPIGFAPAYWAGVTTRELMFDTKKGHEIWKKFMKEFGDMDIFYGPAFVPCGRVSEAVRSKQNKLPGIGLPEDAVVNQYVEGEYMLADEYDRYMADPTDYNTRVMLPRTSSLFEPLSKMLPLNAFLGNYWISALVDPDVHRTFETMLDLANVEREWLGASMEIDKYIKERGYPSFWGGPVLGKAPFDQFADSMRGTQGIIMDMYRQPKKLLQAMERHLQWMIDTSIRGVPMAANPIVVIALHKGDDTFMSDKQFDEFYWPTLRQLFQEFINEGLVPLTFAEGRYNRRLKQIADCPPGVIWWFDQTDMKEAKRILGDKCCIMGNVPISLMVTGTPAQVKEYCRRLIEDCAPGGGYILAGGALVDNDRIDNFKAMMDAAKEYGVY